jgi:hypothetical protein
MKLLGSKVELQVTTIVGVTLAWCVLHSAPSMQINKETTNNAALLNTDS